MSSPRQHCPKLTLAAIRLATNNFSEALVIGRGNFGKVYKGSIDKGKTAVAVKRHDDQSSQGGTEFHKEIESLTGIRHHNIVSLIGYCNDKGEMILVYEYVANHTLRHHLELSKEGKSSLTWHQRISILIGAAQGLHHLHDGIPGCSIIHRDVKSSNILLDENFVAKVSDFGLAKHVDIDKSHVSTELKGTYAYFDPYYANTNGKLTMDSDTYSFGVVVLEVLSGGLALDTNRANGEWLLSDRALSRGARVIIDRNVSGHIPDGSLNICYEIAKKCLRYQPKKRPKMSRVLAELQAALRGLQNPTYPYGDELSGSTQQDTSELEQTSNVPAFSMADLQNMTEDFDMKYWIANGSITRDSTVWYGVYGGTQPVAIKYYKTKLPKPEFRAQASTLSNLVHENIVKLYGIYEDEQILVSEFASKGSLHDILHGQQGMNQSYLRASGALSWSQRIKIAADVAKGLCYIHDNKLIHRNIISTNVLLFDDETAKITDLYLSTPCSCNRADPQITCVRYHPPGHGDSQEADVHSFGIVLVELLTGKKLGDHTLPMGKNLVTWATPLLNKKKVLKLVDAKLGEHYPQLAVAQMAKVAASCLAKKASDRPKMNIVLRGLQVVSWETRVYRQKI